MSARSSSSKAAVVAGIAASFLGLAAPGGAQPSSGAAVTPKQGLSIGVAPFERVGDIGNDVPDVSLLLARRLSTLGVERVASPADIGGSAVADPDAKAAADAARRSGVDALVVGRATGLGGKLSIDARLRDGRSGAPVGRRFFVEVARPKDLAAGVDQLAGQVIAQANEAPLVAPAPAASGANPSPQVASSPPPAGAPQHAAAPADAKAAAVTAKPEAGAGDTDDDDKPAAAGSAGFDSDAPITIKSDTLDVFEEKGQRKFVFVGNVRAKQADLNIRSEHLEAFYPPDGSQPDRIVAIGSVSMKQSGRTARCTQATFYRKDDRVVCIGDVAEVEQGCDIVRGREIVFHTTSQMLKVNGAADVRINSEAKGCEQTAAAAGAVQ